MHYVFTSRNAFKFYIDFGSIPSILTYSGALNPSNVADIASRLTVSYKIGGAQSINSLDRPYNLFSVDSTLSGIYLGGTTLDSSLVTSSSYDTNIDFYNNFNFDSNIAGINYISGVVDGDVGNYYNFVDIQIRIADVDAGKVYFDGSTTNCDMLTDYFISGIYDKATSLGYDDGYDIGLDDGYENGYNVGSSDGYDIGYEEGNDAGYNVGYREGSDYGYSLGYDVGYGYGYDDGFEAVGAFDFIIHGVEGFLTAELFPGFSFGLLLTSIAGLGLFIWILKIFAGDNMLVDIFTTLSGLGWDLVSGFNKIFIYMKDTSLSDVLSYGSFPWTEAIIEWIVDQFGWGDVTLLSVLVGGGFTTLVVVSIVKWVIGIIM